MTGNETMGWILGLVAVGSAWIVGEAIVRYSVDGISPRVYENRENVRFIDDPPYDSLDRVEGVVDGRNVVLNRDDERFDSFIPEFELLKKKGSGE